jgi:hypothetical protein
MKRMASKRSRRAVAAMARRGHSHEDENCPDCKLFSRLLRAALLPHGAVSFGGVLTGVRRHCVAAAAAGAPVSRE